MENKQACGEQWCRRLTENISGIRNGHCNQYPALLRLTHNILGFQVTYNYSFFWTVGSWRSDALQNRATLTVEELFSPRDVNIILQIKIVMDLDDFLGLGSQGTVKSGYWWENQRKNKVLIQKASTLSSINGLIYVIWSSKDPSKIKSKLSLESN